MSRYIYTGPNSAVTLKVSDGKGGLKDQDVLFWNGQEVDLPADHEMVASLVAQGYGAADPIADNRTEAGREANRRIEFRLIRPEAPPEPIDPALEAELTFEVQSPDADTIRPRPRPGSQVADAPTIGSGDEEATDETPAESQ